MLRDMLNYPDWKWRKYEMNMATLRFKYRLTTFRTQVKYLKVTFFAHVLRRGPDDLVYRALLGKYLPTIQGNGDGNKDFLWLFSQKGTPLQNRLEANESNMVDEVMIWMRESACLHTDQIILLARNKEKKHLWYQVTREAFIRDTMRSYEQAKLQTPALERNLMKESLAKKYGISNLELNTYEKVRASEPRASEPPLTNGAVKGERDYRLYMRREFKGMAKKIMEEHRSTLDWSNWKTEKKWKCKKCGLDFKTSIGAMGRHIKAHERNFPTKVYRTKKAKNPVLRPQEHIWDKSLGRYFEGSDAYLHDIIHLDGILQEDGLLHCRNPNCRGQKKKSFPGASTKIGAKGRNVARYIRHERRC